MVLVTKFHDSGLSIILKNNGLAYFGRLSCICFENWIKSILSFPSKFFIFSVKKKLKLVEIEGLDLPGELQAEILHPGLPRMSKMVGWRPDRCRKGVILGPLGFRARLAHPNQPTNLLFFITSHVWPSCVSPRVEFGKFFHHHRPCVAKMCYSLASFVSSSSDFAISAFSLVSLPLCEL